MQIIFGHTKRTLHRFVRKLTKAHRLVLFQPRWASTASDVVLALAVTILLSSASVIRKYFGSLFNDQTNYIGRSFTFLYILTKKIIEFVLIYLENKVSLKHFFVKYVMHYIAFVWVWSDVYISLKIYLKTTTFNSFASKNVEISQN